MPKNGREGLSRSNDALLSYEELTRVVTICVDLGMNKLRLTGGEPLVRNGVMDFIQTLAGIKELKETRLTTNGVLLADKAEALFDAGIRRLNISLDSLRQDRFAKITGRDLFQQVRQGIDRALEVGFLIKLNVVAMKGVNDDEFLDFARLALEKPIQVRFIEFMPIGKDSSWERSKFISASELMEVVSSLGEIKPLQSSHMEGPARVFELIDASGHQGRVGFISPISHHFCDQCNRLRLTSAGRLRSCLLHDRETDLKSLLRGGASDEDIRQAVIKTILDKPKGHSMQEGADQVERATCLGQMSHIGG